MLTDRLDVSLDDFSAGTGWHIEPRGACLGDVCVPLAGASTAIDIAERLGMAVVSDAEHGLHAIGPATVSGHALTTAQAPELELPTFDGGTFRLSSLRGQKVVLVAWSPY